MALSGAETKVVEDSATERRAHHVRFREACLCWTQVAANILVPVTIGLAGFGLLQNTWQQRSDAAQQQIELFYSENLGKAQQTLLLLLNDTDLMVLNEARSRSFIDAFVERAIDASGVARPEIIAAIVNLASYFDRVEVCVATGRCDEQTVLTQLGPYGRDFHCLYAGQLSALRQESLILQLGEGLEQFAGRSGGCN